MLYFTYFMMMVYSFVGLILIGIILLQRGRGGGLAGAFGGMGGQSAFGTKAGDVFAKITIYLATVWIVLGGVCVLLASQCKATRLPEGSKVGLKKAAEEKEGAGATKTDDKEKDVDDKKAGTEGDAGPKPSNPPDVKIDDVKKDGKDDAKTDDAKTGVKPEDASVKKDSSEAKDAPAEKPAEPKKAEPKKDDSPAEKEPTEKKPE